MGSPVWSKMKRNHSCLFQKEHSRGNPEMLNPEEERITRRKRRGRTTRRKRRGRTKIELWHSSRPTKASVIQSGLLEKEWLKAHCACRMRLHLCNKGAPRSRPRRHFCAEGGCTPLIRDAPPAEA